MKEKEKISCYIRTKNEEDRIARTIKAAFMVADEVVVIDSKSVDNTVLEAEKAGGRVLSQEWAGLGYQKRIAEEACVYDWLLDLDADEVITEELAQSIKFFFKEHVDPRHVFEIQLKTVDPSGRIWSHERSGWSRNIYNRTVFRMPASSEWDQLQDAIVHTQNLKGDLLHYSFRNLEGLVGKFNSSSSRRASLGNLKSKKILIVRIFFGLPFYFFKYYFLRKMFLAGFYGFSAAIISSLSRWLSDVKMYERHLIKK